jgi:hypothetical protein
MRQYQDRSPSNIEREVAAHRADIADTVAEIKERLSPGELLDGIFRDPRTREASACCGLRCQAVDPSARPQRTCPARARLPGEQCQSERRP